MKLADFSFFFQQFVLASVVLKVFHNHYKKIVAFRDNTIVIVLDCGQSGIFTSHNHLQHQCPGQAKG
jgi:hypothetical protein